jgi:hypothetical protein
MAYCWPTASGPMDCLGNDNVVRDNNRTVFSAWSVQSLYGKLGRLFKVIHQSVVGWRSEQRKQAVRVEEKSTCEDLMCDLKTLNVL